MATISFTKKEIDFLIQELGALAEFAEEQAASKRPLIESVYQKVLSAKHKSRKTKIVAYCTCRMPWRSKVTGKCAVCGLLVKFPNPGAEKLGIDKR